MRKADTRLKKRPSQVPALLRQLLTSVPAERQSLKEKLIRELADPRELLSCGILDEEHPLYRNTLVVEDAFESVTNGMENPEVMEALHQIPEDSLIAPWKRCVLAVQALYAADPVSAAQATASIPEGTPPRLLAELALALANNSLQSLSPEAERFAGKLLLKPDFVSSAGEQMEEALEMGMIDLYADTAAMLVRDLEREYPEASLEFALWSIERLIAAEESLLPLQRRLTGILGEGETARLSALASADEDADAALFFWLKFILAELRSAAMTDEELSLALAYSSDLSLHGTIDYSGSETDQSEEDRLFRAQIMRLLEQLNQECAGRFGETETVVLNTPADCRELAARLSPAKLPEPLRFPVAGEQEAAGKRQSDDAADREPQQLELFA